MMEDPDARLGGHDDPVLLEQLHADAELVVPIAGRTRYEVQVEVEDPDDAPKAWMPVAVVEASGARAAMRMVAAGIGASNGYNVKPGDTLRAIPVHNITQLKLDVETTTRLRLS